MTALIDSIVSVPGVRAVGLFDPGEVCVEHHLSSPFTQAHLAACAREFHGTRDVLQASGVNLVEPGVEQIYLRGEHGWLLARQHHHFLTVILGTQKPNGTMLRIALNVIDARLRVASGQLEGNRRIVRRPATNLELPVMTDAGPAVAKQLLAILQRHLGPAAKPVLRQEMRYMGITPKTLTRARYPELVVRVAGRIGNPRWRDAFERQAAALLDG